MTRDDDYTDTIREARDALRRRLDRVTEGSPTTPSGMVASLERAIAALTAILEKQGSDG